MSPGRGKTANPSSGLGLPLLQSVRLAGSATWWRMPNQPVVAPEPLVHPSYLKSEGFTRGIGGDAGCLWGESARPWAQQHPYVRGPIAGKVGLEVNMPGRHGQVRLSWPLTQMHWRRREFEFPSDFGVRVSDLGKRRSLSAGPFAASSRTSPPSVVSRLGSKAGRDARGSSPDGNPPRGRIASGEQSR